MRQVQLILATACLTLGVTTNSGSVAAQPNDEQPITAQEKKLPIPDADTQRAAEKEIKSVLKQDFAQAVQPSTKHALAKKLLQIAIDTKDAPANRFVLLREARDFAGAAGALGTVLDAVDRLAEWYDVDALELKTEALTKASKLGLAVPVTKAQAGAVMALLEQALAADKYSVAVRLAPVVKYAAAQAEDRELQKVVTLRSAELGDLQLGHERFQRAQKTLESAPNDAAAHVAVGRFLCFLKGDWNSGLVHLAQGDDGVLKALAVKDRARPVDAAERMALGDGWWDVGHKESGLAKEIVLLRSRHWYTEAAPGLIGLTKAKAEQRLKEITKLTASAPPSVATVAKEANVDNFAFKDRADQALRERLWKAHGGSEASEAAVARGLLWLAKQQFPDGAWRLDGKYPDRGTKNDTAGTAFGLLPMLAAGRTDKAVLKGLDFLARRQNKKSGDLGGGMYAHGLGAIALCEAYDMIRSPQLKASAQLAVNYIVSAQHEAGGWRYAPGQAGDTSVTGWQIMALKSAGRAGLKVPKGALPAALKFIESTCDVSNEGYGYTGVGSTPTMTAVALLCRQRQEGWDASNLRLVKAIDAYVKPQLVNRPRKDIYFYYYATQVMHHFGGNDWKDWNTKMRDFLIETQDDDKQSPHYGSWSSAGDTHAAAGGRLMVTSMNLLTLQVYYRYPAAVAAK